MSKMPSWDDQQAFLTVLETGSLAAAARSLGLAHPTVRARIASLEERLGTTLFTRSGKGLKPTAQAEALACPARSMARAADLFGRLAAAAPTVAGVARLSVSEFMGVEVIPAILARLRQTTPDLSVELVLSNRQADVLGQEVDVAVRNVVPAQNALVVKKIPAIPLGLFAAPSYLARRGHPLVLEDLKQHDVIGPDRSKSDMPLAERLLPGYRPSDFVLRTDSHPAQIAAARAGVGIAAIQIPVGESDHGLVRLLPESDVGEIPLYVVMHEDLRNAPRVRALFDALVTGLQAAV